MKASVKDKAPPKHKALADTLVPGPYPQPSLDGALPRFRQAKI